MNETSRDDASAPIDQTSDDTVVTNNVTRLGHPAPSPMCERTVLSAAPADNVTRLETPVAHSPAKEEHEPDYRFTLANERTFLAWMRTALALLAGAVGLMHFAKPLTGIDPDKLFGIILAGTGLMAILYATWRWHSIQRAMCKDAPLPGGTMIWFISGLLILTGSLAGLIALLSGGLL